MKPKADTRDRQTVKRNVGAKLRAKSTPATPIPPSSRWFVDARITVLTEQMGKQPFRALFYDKATCQFYAGSGRTAFEAVAWCMDEFIKRGILGRGPMASRNTNTYPGDGLSP